MTEKTDKRGELQDDNQFKTLGTNRQKHLCLSVFICGSIFLHQTFAYLRSSVDKNLPEKHFIQHFFIFTGENPNRASDLLALRVRLHRRPNRDRWERGRDRGLRFARANSSRPRVLRQA